MDKGGNKCQCIMHDVSPQLRTLAPIVEGTGSPYFHRELGTGHRSEKREIFWQGNTHNV
jgi:hypothetical protein